MAKQVTTTLIDDLDGSKADETLRFGLDGRSYTVDLSKRNAAALRKALAPYVEVATIERRTAAGTGRRGAGAPGSGAQGLGGVDPRAVRAWAKSRRINVNERGRVPAEVVERYLAAK